MINLSASPSIIRLDASVKTEDTVIISYYGDPFYKVMITEQLSGASPVILDLPKKIESYLVAQGGSGQDFDDYVESKKAESYLKGEFSSASIKLGSFAVYKLYLLPEGFDERNFNPVTNDFLKETITVNCIAKRSDFGILQDKYTEAGGTYIYHQFYTTRPAFLQAFICFDAPVDDGTGFLNPVNIATWGLYEKPHIYVSNSFETFYNLERNQLLAGNNYYLLLRLFGTKGEWDCVVIPFVTLKRKLEIKLEKINILNNGGDNGGESEAEARFTFDVSDGAENKSIVYNEPDLSINTKVLNTNWHVQFGPKKVERNSVINVLTMGEESDSPDFPPVAEFEGPKEIAINGIGILSGEELLLPYGRNNETVIQSPLKYHAKPLEPESGDFMEFTTTGWFSVSYS